MPQCHLQTLWEPSEANVSNLVEFSTCVGKIPWRRRWQPTPVYSCLENPVDRGVWQEPLVGQRSPWGRRGQRVRHNWGDWVQHIGIPSFKLIWLFWVFFFPATRMTGITLAQSWTWAVEPDLFLTNLGHSVFQPQFCQMWNGRLSNCL